MAEEEQNIYARALGRVAGRKLRENRVLTAAASAAGTTAKATGKAARSLWLQIMGVFFAFFAVGGGVAAWREFHRGDMNKFLLSAGFAVLFFWFAGTSFWKAKK